MRCEEAIYEVIPFYYGELGEKEKKEYVRHTTICTFCARLSFKLRKAKKFLDDNKPAFVCTELADEIVIRK